MKKLFLLLGLLILGGCTALCASLPTIVEPFNPLCPPSPTATPMSVVIVK